MFISGGVGLTPFMSMVEYLTQSGKDRPITWIHGSRSYAVHAFRATVSELSGRHGTMSVHTFYDELDSQDTSYKGYVDLGKVNEAIVPNADYYICGPGVFIKKHFEYLRAQGVDARAIHFEEFGPAILVVE